MTPRILLRKITEDDLPVLYQHQCEAEAVEMAAFPSRDWSAFTKHWTRILADDSNITRAIIIDGRVAGHIASFGDRDAREVGYWIGKEFWGRGIASAALSQLVHEEPIRPLFAHVVTHNTRSVRVLERCGFVRAANQSAAAATGGDVVDELIMRLDATDPVRGGE